LYNSSESSTYVLNGDAFSIVYGDGSSATGTLVQDTIHIGDLVVENQIFAECTEFPADVTNEPMDGLLGLGFASIANTRANTVLDNLFAQKQITQKVFSFYLNRFLLLDHENKSLTKRLRLHILFV
jgi:hypothetical protein